jgi:hypothetical protein
MHDFETGLAGEPGAQALYQDGVDFDGDDARGAAQQLLCQRTLAGTDFDHEVFARGADGHGNPLQNARVRQEVLAEFWRQGGG